MACLYHAAPQAGEEQYLSNIDLELSVGMIVPPIPVSLAIPLFQAIEVVILPMIVL